MKLLSRITCLLLLAITWEKPRAVTGNEVGIEDIRSTCQAEHNISESEIDKLENFFIEDDDVDKTKLQCFAHCFIKKMGYLDENDKFDVEKIENSSQIHGVDIEKISDCKAKHDMTDDPCEYSLDMLMCVMA